MGYSKMTELQLNEFKKIVKSSEMFSDTASDRDCLPSKFFDIDREDDLVHHIPTLIKIAPNRQRETVVIFPDIIEFYSYFDESRFRLLVGIYDEIGKNTNWTNIHEFIFKNSNRNYIFGERSRKIVRDHYERTGIGNYTNRTELEADILKKYWKSTVDFELKIVDQKQIQCIAKLEKLKKNFSSNYILHNEESTTFTLPFMT